MTDDRYTAQERGGSGSQIDSDDTGAIRQEIELTRQRISRDLDQIGERLNPQYVKQQVKDNIRDATIGRVEDMAKGAADRVNEARRGIVETVKENPLPAALAAIGIGWLYINSRKQSSGMDGSGNSRSERQWSDGGYGSLSAYSPPASGFGARSGFEQGEEDRGAIDRVKEKAGAVGENIKDAGHTIREKVGEVSGSAQDAAHRVMEMEKRQARRLEDMFFENPLAMGAATIALGMAVGLAAPRTHAETKLVGDVRDKVVDRVSEKASETADKAQHAMERALDEGSGPQRSEAELR
jgi:gas vesicle protein